MESMSQKLKDLQERKPDAFVVLGAVSGLSADRIKEISEGSEMSFPEKIILESCADAE